MTEDPRDLLNRLAERAPLAAPDLADRVLVRARSARRRRRAGLALASAGTVAAVVLGGLWIGDPGGAGQVQPSTRSDPATNTSAGEAGTPSDRVQVAANAIEHVVPEILVDRLEKLVLSDRVCDSPRVAGESMTDCPRWTSAELDYLTRRLERLAPVRVVDGDPPAVEPGTVAVSVASLHVTGDTASVFAFAAGGSGRDCRGQTYALLRTAGGWKPTDTDGFAVIC